MDKWEKYYAHSDAEVKDRRPEEPGAKWHLLKDHLLAVAQTSKQFALEARPGDDGFAVAAYWAGMLHDLGKYNDAFQQMLRDTAKGLPKRRTPHAKYGAAMAVNEKSFDVAFAIYGHHAGLPPGSIHQDLEPVDTTLAKDLANIAIGDGIAEISTDQPPPCCWDRRDARPFDLRVRMLLSCLVDADRIDTAHHRVGKQLVPTVLDAAILYGRLITFIGNRASRLGPNTVRNARRMVLDSCLSAASWPERLLSLSVPTGGGKTLASMAFALKRALERPGEVRRIIVVVPYLSIIDQNASVYAEALGEEYILEHHSGDFMNLRTVGVGDDARFAPAKPDEEDSSEINARVSREAEENWDAPIIITTSVRFFESLFSDHPRDLRRLHNVARSVVILDEVQTLPKKLLGATLSMMKGLADDWGATFVFCTATQPAFERHSEDDPDDLRWPKGTVKEIIPDPMALFDQLKRTKVEWPLRDDQGARVKTPWPDVARMMLKEQQALCIVNTKNHARLLYDELIEQRGKDHSNVWHLSTRMCPMHRLDTIGNIRNAIASDHPCLVVSTQLIEAGVDLDFPVVFRALGPLDSIAQAAGRCDREGNLTEKLGRPGGKVVVFEPEDPKTPPGAYKLATEITAQLMRDPELSIHNPICIRRFFNKYYQGQQDPDDIDLLRKRLDFPEVAKRFEYIDDRTRAVIVPYGEQGKRFIDIVRHQCPVRSDMLSLLRRMQPYTVGLYPNEFMESSRLGVITRASEIMDIWVCMEGGNYDPHMGLLITELPDLVA